MSWKRANGGRGWRVTEDGFLELEHMGVVRTPGPPLTMAQMLQDAHRSIAHAAETAQIDVAMLYGLAGVEMASHYVMSPVTPYREVKTLHLDWRRLRWEKETEGISEGEYSGSPWQLRCSVATAVNAQFGLYEDKSQIVIADLWVPAISAMIAAFRLKQLQHRFGSDPMRLHAAWNMGGVQGANLNDFPWGMVTRCHDKRAPDPKRPETFARWYNDAVFVLRSEGLYGI